jgi:nitrogen fixation negative regulator NifL
MGIFGRLLPQSLVSRIYALYIAVLTLFIGGGLAAYYFTEFQQQVEKTYQDGQTLIDVVQHTVSDSAVIGDYDTIQRTLEHTIRNSRFARAEFIEVHGSRIAADNILPADATPPAWLVRNIQARLYELNNVLNVGGTDYGVLRLRFSAQSVAADLWSHALSALLFATACLVGGMVLIRLPLQRWLAGFDRMRSYEAEVRTGTDPPKELLPDDAPLELRAAFQMLNQTASSLISQRIEAAVTLNAVGDGVLTADTANRVIYCNPAACQLFGIAAADMIGLELSALLPGIFPPGMPPADWNGRPIAMKRSGGLNVYLDTTLSTIRSSSGDTAGHVLACRDITEAHKLAERLREQLDRREKTLASLQQILSELEQDQPDRATALDDIDTLSARVGTLIAEREAGRLALTNQKFALDQHTVVSVTDLEGTITFANDRFCEISGYSREELIGSNHRLIKSGQHSPEFYRDLWETIASGKVWRGEIKNRKKSGEYYWVAATIVPLKDAHGRPVEYIGIRNDITERKAVEERLAEQLNFIEVLLETIPIPAYLKDARGRYRLFNRAFEESFGIVRDDWIGKTVFELMPPEMARITHDVDQQVMFDGVKRMYESRFRNGHTREERDGIFWKARLMKANGAIGGLVGAMIDITDRKRFERELEAAKLAAESASQAKSDFLANMSHEIRTPMNGIIGMTELALGTELAPTQRDYLNIVRNSAEALLVILNDILDFSKIEAGMLTVEEIAYKLPDTLGEALKSIAARAWKKGLALSLDLPPTLPETIEGDPGRLRQIVTNLCDNAVKFSASGEIIVRARFTEPADGDGELAVSVQDNGVGIPPDKQVRIFEAFSQADTSTTRKYGGTGLGLTISARLAHLMGGRIWVDSSPGHGSTFHFTVRVKRPFSQIAHRTLGEAGRREALRGVPVLVAGGHPINRQCVADWLTAWGCCVDEAADAQTILARCRARQSGDTRYRLIVVDAHSPAGDGLALVEALRDESLAADASVILLSASGASGDSGRVTTLGIAGHLTSPPTPTELGDAIARALGEGGTGHAPARPALTEHARSLSILLVEDHPINQRIATQLFEKWGHSVILAENGQRAVDLFPTTRWDIVFMDMQMPVMDGLEAARRIRALETAGRHTPIVAMTANAMVADRKLCLAAGMDEHIAKPMDVTTLHRLLEEHCTRCSPKRSTSRVAVDPMTIESALAAVDPEILNAIGRIAATQLPADLAAALAARRDQDWARLKHLAHDIKSTLAWFELHELADIARRIEAAPDETSEEVLQSLRAAADIVAAGLTNRTAEAAVVASR